MERLGGEDRGRISAIRKVALASLIGTTIEWYDFFIYGTAAALEFPALFFPEQETGDQGAVPEGNLELVYAVAYRRVLAQA